MMINLDAEVAILEKVRVGLIGCGGFATDHVRRLLAIPEAELVALCDVNPMSFTRLGRRVPEMPPMPTFVDYREMLASVELDAVQVLTPHAAHFEQVMYALERDLHVLMEKPMVSTVAEAQALIEAMRGKKRVVVVSYQRHYQKAYQYMRDLLSDPMMGPVQMVAARQAQNWLRTTAGTWRQDPEQSGGGHLNDTGSHLLDIVLWTTGLQPQTVHVFSENFDSAVNVNTALSARCTNGALLNLTVVGHTPEWSQDITVWTDRGVVYCRDGRVKAKLRDKDVELVAPDEPDNDSADHNFIAAILGKEEVKSRPEDAIKVVQLTQAAWRSVATGGPVTLAPLF